ncbi:hypothetical protein EEP06_12665 [Salmonella enterica]|nr:hypothetical protein [Salmonella enterica]
MVSGRSRGRGETQHIASKSADKHATSCVRGRRAPGRFAQIRDCLFSDLQGGKRVIDMTL